MSDEMTREVSTANDYLLGTNGTEISAMLPVHGVNTRQRAFRLAAWIVVMGYSLPEEPGQEGVEFDDVLGEVMGA